MLKKPSWTLWTSSTPKFYPHWRRIYHQLNLASNTYKKSLQGLFARIVSLKRWATLNCARLWILYRLQATIFTPDFSAWNSFEFFQMDAWCPATQDRSSVEVMGLLYYWWWKCSPWRVSQWSNSNASNQIQKLPSSSCGETCWKCGYSSVRNYLFDYMFFLSSLVQNTFTFASLSAILFSLLKLPKCIIWSWRSPVVQMIRVGMSDSSYSHSGIQIINKAYLFYFHA